MSARPSAAAAPRDARRSLLWTGVILGIGVIGTLDGVVLHELLQWHKFYVHTTEFWRTFIDGIFHFVSSAFLFWGAMRLWTSRQLLSQVGRSRLLWAGILLGMGGFNLYDGVIQHKVLQLHPVREGVAGAAIVPYDVAFNGIALLLLLGGWLLWRGTRSQVTTHSTGSPPPPEVQRQPHEARR